MTIQSNKRLKKIILFLVLGFLVLFIFRLAYGYTKTNESYEAVGQYLNAAVSSQRNYASKKIKMGSTAGTQSSVTVDQKYEKIAEVQSKSLAFDEEEKEVRSQIENYSALIQFEKKSGNKGNRRLNLIIGVPPDNFDALYEDLTKIGNIQSKQITKTDKTNEYKELNAKKASLEQIRKSLLELKSKGGRIDEYMQLENRILEIEEQLQGLGVSLGDFDDENEFCTVQFSLLEGREAKISIIHRLKVALEWTITYYLMTMATLFFLVLFAYLAVMLLDRLKLLQKE